MRKVTFDNFKSLLDLQKAFPTEKSCIHFLEYKLWKDSEPISPYDPTSKVYKRGDGLYRCKNTGKNVNIRIGTIFEGTKLSLRTWFIAVYLLTIYSKGISSLLLSKDLSVKQKTAWFLTQRIRQCYKTNFKEKLDGDVGHD